MRVLHVCKTSDGAWWAANQAAELVRRGVEVHVALPRPNGRALPYWQKAGAQVHILDLDFPTSESRKLGLQFDVSAFDDVKSNPELPAILEMLGKYAQRRRKDVVLIRNGRAKSEIAEAAPGAELLSYTTLETFLPKLAGLRALFTSHLHLAITSYAQRVPTYSLYVREKTRRFYEQIGRPERALDLKTATVTDLKRFLAAAEKAKWTDADEATLQRLKAEAQKLVALIR